MLYSGHSGPCCYSLLSCCRGDSDTSVTVRDPRFGEARVVLSARSFTTMLYAGADTVPLD